MGAMNNLVTVAHEAGVPLNDDINQMRKDAVKSVLGRLAYNQVGQDLLAALGLEKHTRAELAAMVTLTKAEAVDLKYGTILHHIIKRNADNTPMRLRVSGKCQTWVRRPDEFKLPVKYGFYESGYLTPQNAGEWYVA
jgi:hypothetical protein